MSFPRYPFYKPSGVEWLGEVPEHWEVRRIASLYSEVVEAGNEDLPVLSVSIHHGVSDSELSEEELDRKVVRSEDRSKYKHVAPGDLVYNMMRAWQGAFGSVVVEGMVSPAYVVARPKTSLPTEWVEYLLRTEFAVNEIKRFSRGITDFRLRLYWDEFKNLRICSPPSQERACILRFLDRETAKIDALIGEQQRLIELLQEKRQAVISHAVTKGLNPNAPMKDSGVEWLEDVPEHWDVTPLMRLTQPTRPIMYGIVLPGPDVEEGVPILKGGNVKPSRMALECMAKTTPEIEAPFARARLRAGDLVYGIRGSIGDCEIVPIELEGCNITQDVARIAPLTNLCPKWLRYAMLSRPVAEGLACGSLGAAVKGINIFDLKRARIPVPPSDEMKHIADVLSSEVSRLLSLSLSAETAIGLLRERRSALISAAVTGQIDVRNLAPDGDAA